jgi:8-oxo-dGTP pyrophosphatase MutT (NUDIX family)
MVAAAPMSALLARLGGARRGKGGGKAVDEPPHLPSLFFEFGAHDSTGVPKYGKASVEAALSNLCIAPRRAARPLSSGSSSSSGSGPVGSVGEPALLLLPSVVVLGSGAGHEARYLAQHGQCRVVAAEAQRPSQLARARALAREAPVAGLQVVEDARSSGEAGRFDAAALWYAPDCAQSIELAAQLLRPGGALFLEAVVLGEGAPASEYAAYAGAAAPVREGELLAALEACGFEGVSKVRLATAWQGALSRVPQLSPLADAARRGSLVGLRLLCHLRAAPGLSSSASSVSAGSSHGSPNSSISRTASSNYKAAQTRVRSESGAKLRAACVCVRPRAAALPPRASLARLSVSGAALFGGGGAGGAGGADAPTEWEVLLVQRKSQTKWSVPGGGIDPGEEPAVAAAREAFEEGGVVGAMGPSIGRFCVPSQKDGHEMRNTSAFLLSVSYQLTDGEWSESLLRNRAWMPLTSDMVASLESKPLDKDILREAMAHLRRGGPPPAPPAPPT